MAALGEKATHPVVYFSQKKNTSDLIRNLMGQSSKSVEEGKNLPDNPDFYPWLASLDHDSSVFACYYVSS